MAKEAKKYKIRLAKDRTRKEDSRGVYVAVNGVGMFVPRGVEVELDEPYFVALKNAVTEEDNAEDFITQELQKSNKDINA